MTPSLPGSLVLALRDYAARLQSRFGSRLRFVRLYGSWARGEAHAGSDIDVAAVVEGLTIDEWREAVGDVWLTQEALDVELSPFVLPGARFDLLVRRERRIAADILREGIAP